MRTQENPLLNSNEENISFKTYLINTTKDILIGILFLIICYFTGDYISNNCEDPSCKSYLHFLKAKQVNNFMNGLVICLPLITEIQIMLSLLKYLYTDHTRRGANKYLVVFILSIVLVQQTEPTTFNDASQRLSNVM